MNRSGKQIKQVMRTGERVVPVKNRILFSSLNIFPILYFYENDEWCGHAAHLYPPYVEPWPLGVHAAEGLVHPVHGAWPGAGGSHMFI